MALIYLLLKKIKFWSDWFLISLTFFEFELIWKQQAIYNIWIKKSTKKIAWFDCVSIWIDHSIIYVYLRAKTTAVVFAKTIEFVDCSQRDNAHACLFVFLKFSPVLFLVFYWFKFIQPHMYVNQFNFNSIEFHYFQPNSLKNQSILKLCNKHLLFMHKAEYCWQPQQNYWNKQCNFIKSFAWQ